MDEHPGYDHDYGYLPEKYWDKHDTCEFLLGQVETFLLGEDYIRLRSREIDYYPNALPGEGELILDYLLRVGRQEDHDDIVMRHTIYALLSDSCYFIREALEASLKKRLTVALALLRKPFVYNLPVLLRIFLEEGFLEQFNTREDFDGASMPKGDLLELIEASCALAFSQSLERDDVYNVIFNREDPHSLINMSNMALHPATTRHWASMTGAKNLNLMFNTPESLDSQWGYIYRKLPFLLNYLLECTELIVFNVLNLDPALFEERLEERAAFFVSKGMGDGEA